MLELVITCPGQPELVLEVGDAPITVGRGEDCSAFLIEKKASRKHLTIRRTRSGSVVAEDHDSSNGTWFVADAGEDQRFLRRVFEEGDVLRIGDTRIQLRPSAGAAAAAPVVSGTLMLQPASSDAPKAPQPEPQPAMARTPSVEARWDDEPRPSRQPESNKALTRGLIICAAAIAVFAGVELYLGKKAGQKSVRKEAHLEALRILEHVGGSTEEFAKLRDGFRAKHPMAPELMTLNRYLERMRDREAFVRTKRDALNQLQGQMDLAQRSDVRMRLLQLMRELPDQPDYVQDITRMLTDLDRRKAAEDLEVLRTLEASVSKLRAKKEYARAQRLLRAFESTHEGMGVEAAERWRALSADVTEEVQATSAALWKTYGLEKDPSKQRALLAEAWPALVGTKAGDLISEKLRSAAALAAPRTGTPWVPGQPARPGTQPGNATPSVPTVTDELLARAKKAEELLSQRDWVGGRAALADLAVKAEGGRLQVEWKARLGEVDSVLGLVRTLAEAADAERKPRRKLSSGSWSVTNADPAQVTLTSKRKGSLIHKWSDLPEQDVLTLLTPARITVPQRKAVAILAANLGDRKAFVEALLPVYEKGGDLAGLNTVVARHLYGRSTPPEGGYRAYKGELLDAAGFKRRQTQERVAFLKTDADRVLGLLAKESAFKKLAKLKALRTELDVRRTYALTAIFNTKHYPYPYQKGSSNYRAVQGEIDRRTARVKEIWDDPMRIVVKRAGQLAKHLDAWDAIVSELEAKEIDVEDLKAKIEPYALYVTGEPISIREFYTSQAEAEWLSYNRWVMEAYNPARTEFAKESERKQVQVTNEYRMMIGFTAAVNPGAAPYDSITKDNVIQVLDQAVVAKLSPLRAVRVDNKCVRAARAHSEDMAMRGYFAHQAPPNPATGAGATGPADRMRTHGYHGFGYSENIAMSASPTQAHMMWIHSSGHHRNILSGWTDLGSGVGGRNFTQNFGTGGGDRPEIRADTAVREREGRSGRRRR